MSYAPSITDEHAPIDSQAGAYPAQVIVPFWIDACVRLMPPTWPNGKPVSPTLANAVTVAARLLIADIMARPEGHAPLDRDEIARFCGISGRKHATWLFDYLERIGFLRITQHHGDPGRGRRKDTFTVYTEPPLGYVGPRTVGELRQAIADPTYPTDLFITTADNSRSRRRSGIRDVGRDHDPGSGTVINKTPAHPEGPGSGTLVDEHRPGSGTLVNVSAGHAESPGSGTFSRARQSDRSLLSSVEERRGEIEPVPGGAAEPPATGQDEAPSAEAVRLARRLPWDAWAGKRRGRRKPNPEQLRVIARAMDRAVSSGRITWEQATEIGPRALVDANTWKFVEGAYGEKLEAYLEASIAPASEQLPLPAAVNSEPVAEQPAEPTAPALRPVRQPLPDCPDCGAREGDPAGSRFTQDPTSGRNIVCRCRKAAS